MVRIERQGVAAVPKVRLQVRELAIATKVV